MLVRALGQPFVITPISTMATAGVEPSQTAAASSIFNIMRNLGGSIGIALLQTFTTWREHFHFDVIAQRVTQNGLLAQERIQGMAQQFVADAGDPSAATQMAIAQIRNLVRRDAFVMAYSDCFYIMGAVLLLSMLAIFLLQKPKAGAGGGH